MKIGIKDKKEVTLKFESHNKGVKRQTDTKADGKQTNEKKM